MLDFSRLKYRLREIPVKSLFTEYPDLEEIYNEAKMMNGSASHKPISPQELMAFIVYSYDLQSPIVREASIHKRRLEALNLIDYIVRTEEDFAEKPELVQFVTGANPFVNRLALHYCKLQNSVDWMELCRLQDILDDVDLTLKSESEGTGSKSANEMLKIKLDIMEKSQKIRDKMRFLATGLFMADANLSNYSASHMILEKRKAIITPERYVSAKRAARETEE